MVVSIILRGVSMKEPGNRNGFSNISTVVQYEHTRSKKYVSELQVQMVYKAKYGSTIRNTQKRNCRITYSAGEMYDNNRKNGVCVCVHMCARVAYVCARANVCVYM